MNLIKQITKNMLPASFFGGAMGCIVTAIVALVPGVLFAGFVTLLVALVVTLDRGY
jgi:hypothetical protein